MVILQLRCKAKVRVVRFQVGDRRVQLDTIRRQGVAVRPFQKMATDHVFQANLVVQLAAVVSYTRQKVRQLARVGEELMHGVTENQASSQ